MAPIAYTHKQEPAPNGVISATAANENDPVSTPTTTAERKSAHPPTGLATTAEIKFINRPVYLLLITSSSIFVSELLIMMVLRFLPPLSFLKEALLDAGLLSITVSPVLYFFVFKLLNQHIEKQRLAEAEKTTLINELHTALDEVKTLRGILPICASCKKIRDDKGFWQQVEVYVSAYSDAMFSHGCCPECAEKILETLDDPAV